MYSRRHENPWIRLFHEKFEFVQVVLVWVKISLLSFSRNVLMYSNRKEGFISLQNWYHKISTEKLLTNWLTWIMAYFWGKRLIHWCTYFESPLQVYVTNVARTVGIKPNTRWWQNYVLIFFTNFVIMIVK